MSELIPVAKGDEYHEVHPTCLAAHKAVGFVECERREVMEEGEGEQAALTAKQMKEALTVRGIEFKLNASKAELQALLDAAG
jgi:hypothetical protein